MDSLLNSTRGSVSVGSPILQADENTYTHEQTHSHPPIHAHTYPHRRAHTPVPRYTPHIYAHKQSHNEDRYKNCQLITSKPNSTTHQQDNNNHDHDGSKIQGWFKIHKLINRTQRKSRHEGPKSWSSQSLQKRLLMVLNVLRRN